MGTLLQTVHLPLVTRVSAGAFDDVPEALAACNLSFARALVIMGDGPTQPPAHRVATALEAAGVTVRVEEVFGGTFAEADRVKNALIEGFFPQVVLAVGGGSVIDVAKLAASEKRLPWISLPTAASNDGFGSPVAVLATDGKRRSVGATMPSGVIIDLDVLAGAPRRLRLAGVGDLLSNLTACRDWDRAAAADKALVDGMARTFALGAARQVVDAPKPDIDDPAFLERVVEGLLLSGVAMEISGNSRPCSGSEHLISHQLDRMDIEGGLHGEQVGVATIFCTALQGEDPAPLRSFGEAIGMITMPEGLGIDRATFLDAARQAPDTRPGRWTTLTECATDGRTLRATYEAAFGA